MGSGQRRPPGPRIDPPVTTQPSDGTGVTAETPTPHRCIAILTELRDDLPVGHYERPGVIRAIEVLRSEPQ